MHVSHVGLGTELNPSTLETISQMPLRHPSPHGNLPATAPQTAATPTAQPTPPNAEGTPVPLDPSKALLTKGPGSHIPLETFTEEKINSMLEEMMVCSCYLLCLITD